MPAVEQIGQPSMGVVGLVLCRQDGRARPVPQLFLRAALDKATVPLAIAAG
jgi:hypothetical protein